MANLASIGLVVFFGPPFEKLSSHCTKAQSKVKVVDCIYLQGCAAVSEGCPWSNLVLVQLQYPPRVEARLEGEKPDSAWIFYPN